MPRVLLVLALACSPLTALADFQASVDAFKRGDYTEAVRQFRPLAEQGNSTAQFNPGRLCQQGLGVSVDQAQTPEKAP